MANDCWWMSLFLNSFFVCRAECRYSSGTKNLLLINPDAGRKRWPICTRLSRKIPCVKNEKPSEIISSIIYGERRIFAMGGFTPPFQQLLTTSIFSTHVTHHTICKIFFCVFLTKLHTRQDKKKAFVWNPILSLKIQHTKWNSRQNQLQLQPQCSLSQPEEPPDSSTETLLPKPQPAPTPESPSTLRRMAKPKWSLLDAEPPTEEWDGTTPFRCSRTSK